MQTWIPYPDFTRSAIVLSDAHLNQQRKDAFELLDILIAKREKYSNHNVTRMWRGSEHALWKYLSAMCMEWDDRHQTDNMFNDVAEFMCDALDMGRVDVSNRLYQPWWMGKPGTHQGHRSELLRRDPQHYRDHFGPDESNVLPMMWPEWKPPVEIEIPATV